MMDLFWTYFHHIFAAVCAFLCNLSPKLYWRK